MNFNILNDTNEQKSIHVPDISSFTISQLKKKIIEFCKSNSKYVDIEFIIDKPIRSIGKFNIEQGILPRSLDRYTLDRFAFSDRYKDISIKIYEINDYSPNVTIKHNSNNKYIPPNKKQHNTDNTNANTTINNISNTNTYDIESDNDFPPLS